MGFELEADFCCLNVWFFDITDEQTFCDKFYLLMVCVYSCTHSDCPMTIFSVTKLDKYYLRFVLRLEFINAFQKLIKNS